MPTPARDRAHTALGEGRTLHGFWLMLASADLARCAANVGFDWVCLDMQHGATRAPDIAPLSDAVRAGNPDTLVAARVTANRFAEIGMLADARVDAIIVPLVSSADEARAAVAALDFPPQGGERSWGPAQAVLMGEPCGPDDPRPLLLVMIENRAGLDTIDEICAVPGVDGVFVGPSDLALSLGLERGFPYAADVERAIDRVRDAAAAAGLITGIYCATTAETRDRIASGYRFITSGTDTALMRAAVEHALAAAR